MYKIVTSYVNPDLDGVACMLAIASFDPDRRATILGHLDAETSAVLQLLQIAPPTSIVNWDGIEDIWLVDTHHAKQLPADLPFHFVRRITDHHPAGDVDLFTSAKIENETVGAAATLVTEYFMRSTTVPKASIALLLQAAILSNTLEFLAPSTSYRDHAAIKYLNTIARLDDEVVTAMGDAKRGLLSQSTDELLLRDAKLYDTPQGLVAIAQVEAPGALNLLSRVDLLEAMSEFARKKNADSAILSLVDTEVERGVIVVTDGRIQNLLLDGHSKSFSENGIIRFDRLIQRKTDILPYIAIS